MTGWNMLATQKIKQECAKTVYYTFSGDSSCQISNNCVGLVKKLNKSECMNISK